MQFERAPSPSINCRYRALPVQLVKTADGVIVVRGATELRIVGDRAEETMREIWSMAADEPITMDAMAAAYAEPDRASIQALAQRLIDRRILVDSEQLPQATNAANGPETSLEIFYWHFGLTERDVESTLNGRTIAILGVNAISRQLAMALAAANVTNVEVVDYILTRNQRLFGSDTKIDAAAWPSSCAAPVPYASWVEQHALQANDCLVATSDGGATSALLDWNRTCLRLRVNFLPIVLRRMVGYVGPFVVPHETACYQCLCARENSHLSDHEALRASEDKAPQRQGVSGFFPSMGSILGDIAAMELIKFYTGQIPLKVGHLIEVSLLAPSLTTRKVLRVPRCQACAPTMDLSFHSLERADYIPGPQFFEGGKQPTSRPLTPQEKFALPIPSET